MAGRSAALSTTSVLAIDSIAAGGDGVGHLDDGRVTFVPRTAPGDRVEVEIVKRGRRWARARLRRVVDAGAARVDAPCPLYDRCGGCQLQHLDYEAQRAAKAGIIVDALARIGGVEIPRPDVVPSPRPFRYRNRVTFTLRRTRDGEVVAGFHELWRPGRVLDVDARCLLPEPSLTEAWAEVRAAWGAGAERLPPGDELRLTLRSVEGGAVLVIDGGESGGDAPALLDRTPSVRAVWHRAEGGRWTCVAGDAATTERWMGESVPVGPRSFMQVHRALGERLHADVLERLDARAGHRVVDAYAGVGTYARALADEGCRVTAIELDDEAASVAARDAPETLEVFAGRVEDRLAQALPADRVVLNPPRAGLDAAVPELLRAQPVPRAVYVSCDPATLARDLARLGDAYRVTGVTGYDLFPQTAHVETVVTLEAAS